MNFLSHYFIHRQHANPYFTLGKILPDMLRQFGPTNKLRNAANPVSPSRDMEWLEKGVHVHLETDRLFHRSPFFDAKSNRIKHLLRQEHIFRKFRYFYAHLLLELIIDRLLIINHRKAANLFYHHLDTVQKATISAYFRYKGLSINEGKFFQHLKRFTDSQYLYNYLQNEGLVFALERTAHLAGLPLFEKSDKSKLINNIDYLEATIETNYLSIFKKLEKEIPE